MHNRLIDLPRKALALFRRGGTRGASGRTVSYVGDTPDWQLLDERGNHLGTITKTETAPTFGRGAPTYFLARLLYRARDLSTCLGRHVVGAAENSKSEDQTS